MWINIDTSTGAVQVPLYKGASSTFDLGYCFGTTTTGDSLSFHIADGSNNIGSPSASISFDSWIYIVGLVDRTNNLIRIYKNSTEVQTGTDISSILNIDGDIDFQCANPSYDFDGLLDEVRVLNVTRSTPWIKTEYYNQYDPNSFYSIGGEQGLPGMLYSNLQVNTIDLYGNSLPFVNVSIYNQTKRIRSNLTDSNGNTSFMNLIQGDYNFTATITSDIGNHIETVNITSRAISINQSFQIVNLICDIGSNFFEVVDIDGTLVDSGWIVVGNSSHELQNCSIDINGHTRFWWVNTLPYQYNYTVFYQDINYNPQIIRVGSGDITTPNSSIQVQASLTTINFNIKTLITKEAVSGVKLLLTATNTGKSIVNLTTDNDGKATLRWLNSSGINGNYSLELSFFGALRMFNMTSITESLVSEVNFTVSATEDFSIYIQVSLENYETELISLNPTDYISVKWGSQLKLRILFNVSRAVGAEQLLGPTYGDVMTYKILKGADLIQSGNFDIEDDYTGAHSSLINTENLESDVTYLIFVSAQKSGYSIPQDFLLQLNTLKNELILNRSQNDDSIPSVYWSDSIDFSVKPYGEISESFTTETSIFQSIDHSFKLSLPDINTNWNLSRITFNIYNISWNVNVSDINLSIFDPFGVNRVFNISNHAGWDYNLGVWEGITLNLDKGSPTANNNFEFFFNGTFDNTIDVIAHAYFIRDHIGVQYVKYNISNSISILSEYEGWAINNITFNIQNCYNTTTWQKLDLSTLTNVNISTVEGFTYSLYSGDMDGNGVLMMDDRIIYPKDNQFLFLVESNSAIMFDVIIKVEYVQAFYQNLHLETLNITEQQQNIVNGGSFLLSLNDNEWNDNYAQLLINGIKNGSQYFLPSQVAMNITIGGDTFQISNTLIGQGTLSLYNLTKDTLYTAVIETNQPVNFTLSFKIGYSREVYYETLGVITYLIREAPNIYGSVGYYSDLEYYLQSIDTSLIDSDHYTIRFSVNKENYNSGIKDLDFIVMNRLTLINGESTIAKVIEFMYVRDDINFTFLYTDAFTGARITDLKTQYYMWEKYDIEGNVTANGEGILTQTYDNSFVFDFASENRSVGEYLIIFTLDKDNYEYKNAMLRLSIKKRELEYSLGDTFKNYLIRVVQGNTVPIQINLTDPTRGGIPLLNATIILTLNGIDYNFIEDENGIYGLNYSTSNVNAFFSSTTLTGIINITREDYFSEDLFITIVVEMEEIFPGMPTFYFLIILFAIIAVVGSIVGYRVVKNAKIPTFVKNIREVKKRIKDGKEISESLLYSPKEVFVGEMVRDKWSNIGLSMGDILGIEIKRSKKISKIEYTEQEHDLKPLGLILMKWDERIGAELLAKYPQDVNVSEKTLMQIYGTHEYSGEKGLITLLRGNLNALSYYTGPETGYYIILILSAEDDPDMYEGVMANVAPIILQNLEDDAYLQMIPSFFQRISVYPSLSYEQNLIYYYQDSIKHMIITILRDYGVITKSELIIWVRDRNLEGIIDLEAILADLIKIDLIKVASVKGIPSELIFLTKDIFMLRVPPDKLFRDPTNNGLPAQFTKSYQGEVK
ncbi:MAG: LamG-like jellyroll fold domain-containing protein, partial [Promethearchaeota archaeon]